MEVEAWVGKDPFWQRSGAWMRSGLLLCVFNRCGGLYRSANENRRWWERKWYMILLGFQHPSKALRVVVGSQIWMGMLKWYLTKLRRNQSLRVGGVFPNLTMIFEILCWKCCKYLIDNSKDAAEANFDRARLKWQWKESTICVDIQRCHYWKIRGMVPDPRLER